MITWAEEYKRSPRHQVTSNYIYDGDNIIVEYDGSGTLVTKYIYGPNIDEPIRLERSGNICYYHFDGLGSVTDLSNSSSQQVEHYTYSPFGHTRIYDPVTGLKRTSSSYGNFYMFTGRQWDGESGLYYYRARYYDAGLGRFLQTDPVGYEGGSLNLYKYCSNNPLNRVDPFGLCDNWLKELLINLLQKIGAVLTSTEFDALLGAIEKLGERGFFVQSRNPATGLLLAGQHLEHSFKGLGNIVAKLAAPLAIFGTGTEIGQLWAVEAPTLNKVLKSITAASVNTLAFIGAGAVVAGTTATRHGIAASAIGVAFVGGIGETVKNKIYKHIDANIY